MVLTAKEAAAAKNLIAAGADVIGQNVDSPQAGVVAESKGVPWVGYDSNARKSAPKQWLTAATYNWGPYYVKRVKSGDQRNVEAWLLLRLDQGRIHEPRPYGPKVSAKTKAAIAAKRAAIVSGKFNVFTGPIVDQAGKVVVPAGKTPKILPDLYSMQWLVKGVVGKVSTVLPPG